MLLNENQYDALLKIIRDAVSTCCRPDPAKPPYTVHSGHFHFYQDATGKMHVTNLHVMEERAFEQ